MEREVTLPVVNTERRGDYLASDGSKCMFPLAQVVSQLGNLLLHRILRAPQDTATQRAALALQQSKQLRSCLVNTITIITTTIITIIIVDAQYL